MKKVTVEVTTADGKDNGATPMTVLLNRGAGDVRLEGKDYVTNKDGRVSFDLKPGQSLLIECGTEAVVAYDKDQAAAYTPHTQKDDVGTDKASLKPQVPAAKPAPMQVKPPLETKQPANLQPSQAGSSEKKP